jgi:signal transduction histidine kinase
VKLLAPTVDEQAVESTARRRGFLAVAAAVVCFFPLDAFIVQRFDPLLVLARLLWVVLLAVAAALIRVLGPARMGLVDLLLTVGSHVCFVWIVFLTGGAHSPYLPFILVMPVALTHFTMRNVQTTALGWVISGGACMAMLVHAHAEPEALVVWAALVGASGFVALFGTMFQRRLSRKLVGLRAAREGLVVELAEADRQRSYAERLALVGQLAAGVAHEINNPLAFVHANLAFVRVEAERLPETVRAEVVQALHEADRGVERIKTIIRDLRVFSRKDQEALELVYLGEVVADAVVLARASALVPLRVFTSPALPPVRAVARHLCEVVLNLLLNAADALQGLPLDAVREVSLRVYADGSEVCLSVEDTGAGVPAALQDRIFEPFFTTKPIGKGTGLGLALAREYVERFGGQLLAENRSQGGARFIMRLPAVAGAPLAEAPWETQPIGDPDVTPVPRKRSGTHPSA